MALNEISIVNALDMVIEYEQKIRGKEELPKEFAQQAAFRLSTLFGPRKIVPIHEINLSEFSIAVNEAINSCVNETQSPSTEIETATISHV